MTAEELMAELESDPEWVEAQAAEEREIEADEAASRQQQAQLLGELASVGVQVEDVWLLEPSTPNYEQAVPILIDHLGRDYEDAIREGIARALGAKAAARYWAGLVTQYQGLRGEAYPRTRMGLAVALSEMATREQLPDVRRILRDRSWGPGRIFFLRTLTRLRAEDRWQLIASLAADPDLEVEAKHMLRQRRLRER
jgi:HEAT repeat protein